MKKRLIRHIIDLNDGKTYSSEEYLAPLSEHQRFVLRRSLREDVIAYRKDAEHRSGLACIYCLQPVHLSGTKKKEHIFRHAKDLPECPIKTGDRPLDVIRRDRYNGIPESQKHIALKHYIKSTLQRTPGFTDVKTEAVIKGIARLQEWRKPDVSASLRDIRIVFEIQLSKEFLDVIIARESFYRDEKICIVWVFDNFSDDGARFTEKDIYYANKRNAFSITPESRQKTLELGKMVFLCHYQVPILVEGAVCDIWKERLVTFDDLKHDTSTYKIYYHDYDAALNDLKSNLKLSHHEIEAFEAFWINKDTIPSQERWEQNQHWYRLFLQRGTFYEDSQKKSFGEDLTKVLDAIYSLKHHRLIGYSWKTNPWVQLANRFLVARPKFAGLFTSAMKAYNSGEEARSNKVYRQRIAQIKDGIDRGDENFAQNERYRGLFHILFPELFNSHEKAETENNKNK